MLQDKPWAGDAPLLEGQGTVGEERAPGAAVLNGKAQPRARVRPFCRALRATARRALPPTLGAAKSARGPAWTWKEKCRPACRLPLACGRFHILPQGARGSWARAAGFASGYYCKLHRDGRNASGRGAARHPGTSSEGPSREWRGSAPGSRASTKALSFLQGGFPDPSLKAALATLLRSHRTLLAVSAGMKSDSAPRERQRTADLTGGADHGPEPQRLPLLCSFELAGLAGEWC